MDSGISFVTIPIGNPQDITLKALDLLKNSQMIYCEDTRKIKSLLDRLNIDSHEKKLISFHEHSSDSALDRIINFAATQHCVYVSDAGSPLISDPAYPLLKKAMAANINWECASGISASLYALEVSGLPAIPFSFHGFLPRDKGALKTFFGQLREGTHIFFEGVSRVESTLKTLAELYPKHDVVVARELTKTHERVYRFKAQDWAGENITLKGEFTILFYQNEKPKDLELVRLSQEILKDGTKPKLLAKLLSHILDRNTKEIYQEISRDKN